MKSFITALIIAGLIGVGSFFYGEYIGNVADEFIGYNNEIRELILTEEYSKAELEAISMKQYIDGERFVLAMLTDHANIDNIERNLAELCAYAKEEQSHDALAKCDMLVFIF